MEYLSKEKYDSIAAELKRLVDVEFPRIQEDLAEARAQGDLSENSGYRAARRAHGRAISRIRYLQNILKYARVIDPKALPTGEVTLLSRVEFTNLDTGASLAYTIVSSHEMNIEESKISLKSPIGQALMGRKPGDEVTVRVPSGTLRLRIDAITPA